MKKIIQRILLALLAGFVAIQFVRPEKNISVTPSPADVATVHKVPNDVHALLQRACYDCHSNTTKYPWYASIQPVTWWLDSHVREGKRHLNFSEFGTYSKTRAASKLSSLIDEVEGGTMPLKSYLPMHPEARLTPDEIEQLIAWAEALSDELAGN
ncbi:heme-binding domain-containing protein [Oleiharenicola lentus]|uniref:heme-binding domain-containing protein n=1 Tax=Oleiharenicola lentus TaxID=2508720 RepID=UPI003F66F4BA